MVMKATGLKIDEAKFMNLSNFVFERKYDGSRTLFMNGKIVSDKRDGFKEKRYPQISQALKGLNAVLDGELWVESDRVVELSRTENWNEAKFIIFDILELNGQNLRGLPLKARREILSVQFQYIKNYKF